MQISPMLALLELIGDNMELNNKNNITLIYDPQISLAGMLLAEAFFADAFNQYVFPDPEERRRVLSWYFTKSGQKAHVL